MKRGIEEEAELRGTLGYCIASIDDGFAGGSLVHLVSGLRTLKRTRRDTTEHSNLGIKGCPRVPTGSIFRSNRVGLRMTPPCGQSWQKGVGDLKLRAL